MHPLGSLDLASRRDEIDTHSPVNTAMRDGLRNIAELRRLDLYLHDSEGVFRS